MVDGFSAWGGGVDILRMMITGLLTDPTTSVRLMIPKRGRADVVMDFLVAAKRFIASARTGRPTWQSQLKVDENAVAARFTDLGERVRAVFYSKGREHLIAALSCAGVQVAVPTMIPLGTDFPVPWIGYVFDFQHRHLPQYFSKQQRIARDREIGRMLAEAPVVVCNSAAVRRDIFRFHPGCSAQVVTLPFTPIVRAEWLATDPQVVRKAYGLPERFFIVCNQFWMHKDHATAIRAFAALRSAGTHPDVALVCTGEIYDHRSPGYGQSIRRMIQDLNLESAVHMLGYISKADQIALVRASVAVVQPTTFEGGPGGGAVYDAIAVGVPALVSDIEINQEIHDPRCTFFSTGNSDELAALMLKIVDLSQSRSAPECLLDESVGRLRALGAALYGAIALVTRQSTVEALP
jgi:glycosyltransferase involved in cell wall biosynthesis